MATYAGQANGLYDVLREVGASAVGKYRVANDALERYELYRGTDASPDFTAACLEVFPSLPHTTTNTFSADHTYHLVTRLRNKYNLLSQNIIETLIEIDAGGDEVAQRPSDPQTVTVEAAADGKARVHAQYAAGPDGDYAADTWLIYLTDDGGDPDPDVDAPTTETMTFSGGVAILNWLSAASDDEDTIKVLVRTRRIDAGPVNIDSTGTTNYSVTANTDGPATVSGGIFIRSDTEQAQ